MLKAQICHASGMGGESDSPPHIKDHKKCQLGRWARPIRLHKFSPNQPSFLKRFFDHLTTFYLETGKNRLLQREKLNPRECIKKPWIRKLHVHGVYLLDTLYNWSESDFREFKISVSHNIGHWWPLERKNLKIQQKKLKNHTKNSRYEKKLKASEIACPGGALPDTCYHWPRQAPWWL